jgi:hypothetical protein
MSLGAFGITTNSSASDLSIGAAGTTSCTPVTGLTGMQSLTASFRFAYGSGGTNVKCYFQTSLDGGNRWIDIACVVFGLISEEVILNFSSLTPKLTQITPTDGTMPDDSAMDGVLGDRLRLKVVTTGTYAGNTVLVGRIVAH